MAKSTNDLSQLNNLFAGKTVESPKPLDVKGQAPPIESRPNIGWLFFKKYYEGVDFVNTKNNKTTIWKPKNDEILKQKQSSSGYNFIDEPTQTFGLKTTYPGLVLGTGIAHGIGGEEEYKIGFFFDHATGLPMIPASSVKGVLRSAFPYFQKYRNQIHLPDDFKPTDIQKAKAFMIYNLWKDRDFDENPFDESELNNRTIWQAAHWLELSIFEGVNIMRSFAEREITFLGIYERDIFHDAILVKGSLSEKHKNQILGSDAITPHKGKLKNPVPLLFLKVLPEVTFRFQFDLKTPREVDDRLLDVSKEKKLKMFKQILLNQGIGAKTNVGYGQFQVQ
jgi:CRISPR-associated protein Cmr6